MRRGYYWGAPGVLVSGLVWCAAACVALAGEEQLAVYVLLIGGMFIFPGGVLLLKLIGHPGKHSPTNPLNGLAMEGTVWLLAGCWMAFGVQTLRIEWFFPVMLLTIGARYLSFQTLYGLRLYWILGALLCAAGFALGWAMAPVAAGAVCGALTELFFAAVLFVQAKREPVDGSGDPASS